MKKITNNVYGVLTRFSYLNLYVIADDDKLSLIDMMLGKGDVDTLEKELASAGWSLENVQNILITHAHPDHIGGLAELQRRCNATTYAHRIDAMVIRAEKESEMANPDQLSGINRFIYNRVAPNRPAIEPARVDVDLNDGDTLDQVLPGIQVVHLPGHSYGQVGYYIPQDKMLIGGDVMMHFFGSLRMPLRFVSPDWTAAKASIRKVAEMDVDILCLGHGKVIYNANKIIRQYADRITT